MSARSVDTPSEGGRRVTALISADHGGPVSPPPSRDHVTSTDDQHHQHRDTKHDQNVNYNGCIVEHDVHNAWAGTQLLHGEHTSGPWGHSSIDNSEIDMCSSTWKNVESFARMQAASHSVVSTISRYYSLPGLRSERDPHPDHHQASTVRPELEGSLVSDRLAAEALAVFRR